MTLIIACVIIAVLSIFFTKLRAYMSFCALVMGGPCLLVGVFDGDWMMIAVGLFGLAYAFTSAYLTVRWSEPSQRPTLMFRYFVYGLLLFVKVTGIMLIIFIPLVKGLNTVLRSYEEMILVDQSGNQIGTVFVNSDMKDALGNQYDRHDPY